MWYARLDWANTNRDLVVIDAGHQVASRHFAHTAEGLSELTAFLRGIAPFDQIACIIETHQGLLISTLLEEGCTLYPVNPKTIDRCCNASGAKTDLIDAYLLAKTGRSDLANLRKLTPDSAVVQELKSLTRDQDTLVVNRTRLINQLTACFKAYYPAALRLFSKLQQRSTLLFLQTYLTPGTASSASTEQITSVLKQAGHPNPAKVTPEIFETLHQPFLHADAITTRTKSQLMGTLVAQLLPLLEQIATYDKEISTLFLTHDNNEVFSSLLGAGKRLTPRLLTEWGDDCTRYSSSTSVPILAGTASVAFQSDNYAKAHKRYACLKPLRNVPHQFAWQSTRQEAWALVYYKRKRTEGKSHSMAVRSLANV